MVYFKNGQKRYFRNGKCLKGLQKIANRRYFFDVKTGVMKTNNVTYRRVLYYINEKGIVEGWKRGRNYYNSNGRRLSGDREQQFTAYQNARKVVSRITNKKMTQEQKLRACFRWVMPFPRADWRLFAQGGKSWYATFANDILKENQETVYQVQVLLLTLRRPVESEMFISAQMDETMGRLPWMGGNQWTCI